MKPSDFTSQLCASPKGGGRDVGQARPAAASDKLARGGSERLDEGLVELAGVILGAEVLVRHVCVPSPKLRDERGLWHDEQALRLAPLAEREHGLGPSPVLPRLPRREARREQGPGRETRALRRRPLKE